MYRKKFLKRELKLIISKKGELFVYYIFLFTAIFICGCASVMEREKKEETVRYDKKNEKKIVRNLETEERGYIRTLKIRLIEKINFNLDEDGKPLESKKLSTLKYDPEGYLTETIIYDDTDEVKFRFTYDYDKNGTRIKTYRYTNGELTSYYTYDFNEHGNKSKAYRYNTVDELEEYYLYEYDDEGNLVEEEWFSNNGDEVYSIDNDYDNYRKTHSYTYDTNNNLVYEYVFRYDDKGNIIEELVYNSRGRQSGVIQYIYKYF